MNTSKSKNIVVILLVLAVGGLGFISWNQYRELLGLRNSSISESDLAALRQQLLDAESRARQLQAQLAAAGNGTADDAVAADAADAAAAGPGARGGRGGQQGGRGGAAQNAELQALLQTPEAIRLSLTQQKAQYSIQYAALFRSLGLPADKVDQLTSLMADRANIQQDLQAAALAAGINPQDDPAAFRDLVASEQGAVDTQIQALLGADAYAQYQTFQNTMNRRTEVASFQEIMTTAGVPMDAAQVEALVAALATNDTGNTGGGRGGFGGGGGRGGFGGGGGGGNLNVSNVSERNMTAAATVLNPTQLAVLQAVRDEQQASSQLQQMTSSVTGGGRGGRGGGGPGGGGAPGGGGGGN